MWEIEVTDQFAAWYDTLDDQELAELNKRVELLARQGPALRRPYVGAVVGSAFANMKELRCDAARVHLRVLFCFDPRRTAILLLGGDKTGAWNAWYAWAIPQADELYREYLATLREEGLIDGGTS